MGKQSNSEEKLKVSTIVSYALAAGTGAQFIGTFVGTYISIFFTDVFGIPAGAAGVIITLGTIWDAINDPMMGSIADRTKSRWGRFRPYLLYIPVPLAVTSVLLFACPDLSATGKIVWAAVFYVLYGMLTTAIQVPFGAIINAVTNKESERRKMVSSYTLVMGVVTTIAASFSMIFVSIAGRGNPAKGYRVVMGIAGVILVLSNWFCFACTKEKYVEEYHENIPLRTQIKKLIKVKGLIPSIIIWCMAYLSFQGMMGSSSYYILYYVGNPNLIAPYMLVVSLIGLLGIALVLPLFSKIFRDMRTAFAISQAIAVVSNVVLFFAGGKNIGMLFLFTAISSIFATMSNAYIPLIVTEMIDFVYYKTGMQLNGTVGAIRGFSVKCAAAIANAILMFMLSMTGYVANNTEQTTSVLFGINFVRFMVPAIASIVVIIALRFCAGVEYRCE